MSYKKTSISRSDLIRMYWGEEPMSMREIGNVYGVTRQAIFLRMKQYKIGRRKYTFHGVPRVPKVCVACGNLMPSWKGKTCSRECWLDVHYPYVECDCGCCIIFRKKRGYINRASNDRDNRYKGRNFLDRRHFYRFVVETKMLKHHAVDK